MKTYNYINTHDGKCVFTCEAESLVAADLLYEKEMGEHPSKAWRKGWSISVPIQVIT